MNLQTVQTGSFDTVAAIRHLAGQVAELEQRLAVLESAAPSATMDAADSGASLADEAAPTVAREQGARPKSRRGSPS